MDGGGNALCDAGRPVPGGGRIHAELEWDSGGADSGGPGTDGHPRRPLRGDQAQPASASYPAEDLYWLSRIISAESRGEPLLGQIAVGNVILNRVESSQYPDTVEGVVFDTKYGVQFQPVSNGTIYDAPASSSLVAAKLCLEGTDVVGESLYFFSPALSAGRWIVSNATYYTTIGGHQFYV